jgi:hypothetical protein
LNQAIAPLLAELNDKPMAPPREGSRRDLFEAVERTALKPLPAEPYVLGQWSIAATVNVDYHVAVERNFYSVPHELVRKHVDVFVTRTVVQLFHRGERAASHIRLAGQNHWSTLPEHMPPAHSAVANRTPDWVRGQAARVGVATAAYVERLSLPGVTTSSRAPASASCAWPPATRQRSWRPPASGRWPRAPVHRSSSNICSRAAGRSPMPASRTAPATTATSAAPSITTDDRC